MSESLCRCIFCGTDIDWEGTHDVKGNIWECEKCEDYFCTLCFKERTGEYSPPGYYTYKKVLCPDCFTTDNIEEEIQ